MDIGKVIKNYRTQKDLKQSTFAVRCGISQVYLSQIENNKRDPNMSTLKTIAENLDIPLPILFLYAMDENDFETSKQSAFNILIPSLKKLLEESKEEPKSDGIIRRKKHLESLLKTSYDELLDISGDLDSFYSEFIKKQDKGNGRVKERQICPSKGRLKEIQILINKNIFSKRKLPFYIQGAVKGRDNISNSAFHKGNKYKFCTDLKNYFPSINHKIVYDALILDGYSPDIASLLTKLTTYKGSVPQGAPTSPFIANIAFLQFDRKLHAFCKRNNIVYTRFVDDLWFSSQSDFKELTLDIMNLLFETPFSINHKKTCYFDGSAVITGVYTGQNSLQTTKRFNEKMRLSSDESSIQGFEAYIENVKKKSKLKKKSLK